MLIASINHVSPDKPPSGGGNSPPTADHTVATGLMFSNRFIFNVMAMLGIFLTVSFSGKGQLYVPFQDGDQIAFGAAPYTANTGTDFLSLGDNGKRGVQVMVWDGPRTAVFSWHFDPQIGTTLKGNYDLSTLSQINSNYRDYTPFCDPDVVVSQLRNGEIFAMVIGLTIDPAYSTTNPRVLISSFVWSGTEFVPTPNGSGCFQQLFGNVWDPINGSGDYLTNGRSCSLPNIDANKWGQVAFSWAENESNKVRVLTLWPWNPPGTVESFITNPKGNIYANEGYINGTSNGAYDGPCLGLNCDIRELIQLNDAQLMSGFPVAVPGELNPPLFNFYSFPSSDISISEKINGNTYISYAFVRNAAPQSPSQVFYQSGLIVRQRLWGSGCPTFKEEKLPGSTNSIFENEDWLRQNLSGAARIAAPYTDDPRHIDDYAVVQGNAGMGCNDDGYFFGSNLRGWAKIRGNLADLPSDLLLPNLDPSDPGYSADLDIKRRENTRPVVSFISPIFGEIHSLSDNYPFAFTVAWESFDEQIPFFTAQGRNILAATYFMDPALIGVGNPIARVLSSSAVPRPYSVVNFRVNARQTIASIAGRHGQAYMAYDWDNTFERGSNSYKRSTNLPGREAINNSCPDCQFRKAVSGETTSQPEPLVAEPNPSNSSFNIRFAGQENEQIQYFEVLDLQGKTVYSSKGKVDSSNLSWSPEQSANKGIYIVKVVTSTRTLNTRLVRQ